MSNKELPNLIIENEDNSSSVKKNFSYVVWLLIGIVLFGYGLLAFDSGTKISPILNPVKQGGESIEAIMLEAEQGNVVLNKDQVEELVPNWIQLVSNLHSDEYAYGRDSVLPIAHHYLTMPETHKHVLSTHMLLGIVIMVTGFFQFVPAFRRKYRKAHRILGSVYIVSVLASMSMSGYYLLNTKIEDIYSTFMFYVGLWMMFFGTLIAIGMAAYSLYRRDIARHMGWQALGFGMLLTAPTQRIYWILMAPFAGDASFNDMNVVVNVMLFTQVSVFAYLLFLVNRASSPIRKNVMVSSTINNGMWSASKILVPVSISILVFFYIYLAGISGSEILLQTVPLTAALAHDAVINFSSTILVVALSIILFLGAKLLWSFDKIESNTTAVKLIGVSGVIASAILCTWGYQIGLPSADVSVAGVFYMAVGILLLLFSLYFQFSYSRLDAGYQKESLLFVWSITFAPVIQIILFCLIGPLGLIPDIYLTQGHGYQGAAAAGAWVVMMVPLIVSFYSQHTNRYAIN